MFLLVNAISYGGDAFRGRETLRDAPHAVLHEDEVSLDLGELPLGLHQVRVHLHAAPGTPSVAESAAFFEIRMRPPQEEEDGTEQVCRGAGAWGHTQCAAEAEGAPGEEAARRARLLSDAFDEKAWLNEEGWGGERQEEARTALFAEYAALHARMGRADTPVGERRVLLLDQRAGGLGNRLGSVISGLLLAILSRRALAVAWDLGGYLDDGDPARGGIEWQHPSLEAARARYALPPGAAGDTSHWTDMGEMAELLARARPRAWPGRPAAHARGGRALTGRGGGGRYAGTSARRWGRRRWSRLRTRTTTCRSSQATRTTAGASSARWARAPRAHYSTSSSGSRRGCRPRSTPCARASAGARWGCRCAWRATAGRSRCRPTSGDARARTPTLPPSTSDSSSTAGPRPHPPAPAPARARARPRRAPQARGLRRAARAQALTAARGARERDVLRGVGPASALPRGGRAAAGRGPHRLCGSARPRRPRVLQIAPGKRCRL